MSEFNYNEVEVKSEQKDMTPQEIADKMASESEYSLDLNHLPSINHIWVDRGEVMSCEGAQHPSHRHFKVRRGRVTQ